MLVTSRSAAEYRAMFGLTDGPLGQVLDCCAGGSGFVAGEPGTALAVDPAYALGVDELTTQIETGLRDGDRIIDRHTDDFEWGWYGDPARRTRLRQAAGADFLADLRARPDRYVAGALPHLPFAEGSFDLALCSHLLFTWSDLLDADWHRAALRELIRVTHGEIRVYPLVVQGTGRPVRFLDTLRAELDAAGHRTRLQDVPYRFQRGAHQALVVHTG